MPTPMWLWLAALETNCTTKYTAGEKVYVKTYVCPLDMPCFVDKNEVPYLNKCAFETSFDGCEKLCKGECMHGVNSTVKNITVRYTKGKRKETEEEFYADTIAIDFYYCRYKRLPIYTVAHISIGVSVGVTLLCTAVLAIVRHIIKK